MKTIKLLSLLAFTPQLLFAQAQMNMSGGVVINLNGGNATTPIYMVVANSAPNALAAFGNSIINSEGEFNMLKWNIADQTGNYKIPFGDATNAPIPVDFNVTGAGSADGFVNFSTYATGQDNMPLPSGVSSIAHVDTLIPADGAKVYDRFWIVDANSYTTQPEGAMNFSYSAAGMTGDLTFGSTPLAAQMYNSAASFWIVDMYGLDDQMGSVTGIPFSDGAFFPFFTLVENGNPLPITLLNFDAVWGDHQKSHALIQWATASEQDNDFFEIERSTNGIDWRVINKTPGAGNSIHTINYEAIDHNPVNGIAYYRLKQVDFDGTTSFSHPVALHRDVDFASISVFPNPAKDQFNFVLAGLQGDVSLTLIDNAGRTLWSDQIHGAHNNHAGTIACNNFVAGLYTLVVRDENAVQSVKILINK